MTAMGKLAAKLQSAGRNWRWTEEGEGNIIDSDYDEHVHGCVQGPRQVDTKDRQRWRSQRDGNIDDFNEEGGSHPNNSNTQASNKTVFYWHPVCVRGLLV